MQHKRVLVTLFILVFAFAEAQLESAQWFFGQDAGIDFRSGDATASNQGIMSTGEGCATISDSQGNLLFYTDGRTVFNRQHDTMLNGNGLQGDSSSTSSAVAVPLPQSDNLFYVFTVDTDDFVYRNAQGLKYSIVDMSLDNGNGGVLEDSKNTPILDRTSEKLTAVENNSGTGYWIITQFEDRFYSYELTANGLNFTPVISQVDPFIELLDYFITNVDVAAMRGYIKVNSAGTKIAAAHFSNNTLSDFDNVTSVLEARSLAFAQGGELYLYDFDNETGVVSNPIPLMTKEDRGSFYGVEFSPNGTYLYAEVDYLEPSVFSIFEFIGGEIAQFDLTASDIAASKRTIYQDRNELFRGAMQLGVDGNIYHTRIDQNALSIISNPNDESTPVNYRFNALPLSPGRITAYGLPIFVQSFFESFEIEVEDGCLGQPVSYGLDTNTDQFDVTWNFGDARLGTANNSTSDQGTVIYRETGSYNITAVVTTVFQQISLSRTITIFPTIEKENIELQQTTCDQGVNLTFFDLSNLPTTINTNDAQTVQLYHSEIQAREQTNPIDPNIPLYLNEDQRTIFIRIDNDNCFEVIPYQLIVERCPIEVFNFLTPNGDGDNDTLAITNLTGVYASYNLHIYNRYGRLVWKNDQDGTTWDGTSNINGNTGDLLPAGTYYYTIKVNDPTASNLSGYIYLTY